MKIQFRSLQVFHKLQQVRRTFGTTTTSAYRTIENLTHAEQMAFTHLLERSRYEAFLVRRLGFTTNYDAAETWEQQVAINAWRIEQGIS